MNNEYGGPEVRLTRDCPLNSAGEPRVFPSDEDDQSQDVASLR